MTLQERLAGITSPAFRQFLRENEAGDVTRIILSKSAGIDTKEAANQLLSRRKAKDKLPGWFENDSLAYPPPLSVEQSSSEAAARYKTRLLSGAHLVDLTGGMGVDCLELSGNFEKTTFVERDEWLCTLFAHNQKLLSRNPITVENTSAERYLQALPGKATFFIDPARRGQANKKVFRFEDSSPDVLGMLPLLRTKADHLLIKAAPMIDLTQGILQLENVKEVYVVSVKNEVKEVLFLVDFNFSSEPEIHCADLATGNDLFSFRLSDERAVKVGFEEVKNFLYDPNASILKAGAFKSVTQKYRIAKLAANTQLYTSDQLITHFPGRIFEVIDPVLKKSEIKRTIPDGKVNVLTKNYPHSPEEVKKKYGLKDGGEFFLIGFRDFHEKPVLLLAKPVKGKKNTR